MKTLAKEQATDMLERLRSYAAIVYMKEGSKEILSKSKFNHKGNSFTMSVLSNGHIQANSDNGLEIQYFVSCSTSKPSSENSIDNISFNFHVVNRQCLSESDSELADEIGLFAMSMFQRTNAFVWFARMQDETIEEFANILSKMVPSTQ